MQEVSPVDRLADSEIESPEAPETLTGSEAISADLRARALQKQRASQETHAKLRAYDTGNDEFKKKRGFGLLTGGILPVLFFGALAVWFLLGPKQNTSVEAKGDATRMATVVNTPALVAGGFLGSGSGRPTAPLPTLDLRVKCFARADVSGVYSSTVVLSGGMVVPTKYTRVRDGMIWSDRFGWLPLAGFACNGDLVPLEVEFVVPMPAPTPTVRRVVPVATRIPTFVAIPTLTAIPSPTYQTGVVQFYASGNCDVTWLVWNVREVWLLWDGKKEGVPGSLDGRPVVRSLCPFVGMVRLEVVGSDGSRYSRSLNLEH